MINIEKITIRQPITVDNNKDRIKLKRKIAELLGVNIGLIEMRYEDRTRKINGIKKLI